jgi:hypothetical protein
MVNTVLRILFVPGVIHASVPAGSQVVFPGILLPSFLHTKDGGGAISSLGRQLRDPGEKIQRHTLLPDVKDDAVRFLV